EDKVLEVRSEPQGALTGSTGDVMLAYQKAIAHHIGGDALQLMRIIQRLGAGLLEGLCGCVPLLAASGVVRQQVAAVRQALRQHCATEAHKLVIKLLFDPLSHWKSAEKRL